MQGTFARAAATPDLHSPESLTAWCYRVLRNAIVDHHRRRSASVNALDKLASESAIATEPARRPVCSCVFKVLPDLRKDYQAIIRAVEVDGRAVDEVAREIKITANNAYAGCTGRGRRCGKSCSDSASTAAATRPSTPAGIATATTEPPAVRRAAVPRQHR